MPRVTLIGFYRWNPNLFADCVLPQNVSRETLVHRILRTCGDLYPYHQDGDELKVSIDEWFSTRLDGWNRIVNALSAEYNPIENYDRKEDITRGWQDKGTDTENLIGNSQGSSTSNTVANRQERQSAFDSDTYTPIGMEDTTADQTGTSKEDSTTDRTMNYGRGRDETETVRAHGNIGVTTNQQMITEEIRVREEYDIYRIITRDFEDEFLIRIY